MGSRVPAGGSRGKGQASGSSLRMAGVGRRQGDSAGRRRARWMRVRRVWLTDWESGKAAATSGSRRMRSSTRREPCGYEWRARSDKAPALSREGCRLRSCTLLAARSHARPMRQRLRNRVWLAGPSRTRGTETPPTWVGEREVWGCMKHPPEGVSLREGGRAHRGRGRRRGRLGPATCRARRR